MLQVNSCVPISGVPTLLGGLDRTVPGFIPVGSDERQFSNASDNSDSEALAGLALCMPCSSHAR